VSDLLLATGLAAIVPGISFTIRWVSSTPKETHWSGWAATVSYTVATFAIILGARLA